jgi:hypothetical protein
MDDATDRGDEFVASGLASLGIEADETELAVIAGVHRVFGPPIRALIEFDAGETVAERDLDLSQAPPPEESG